MIDRDLFTWSDEQEAARAVAEAEEARKAALRKAACAPHGEVERRRQLAAQATRAALQAGLELSRIQRALR